MTTRLFSPVYFNISFILVGFFLLFNTNLFAQNDLDKRLDFNVKNEAVAAAIFTLSEQADINITFPSNLFSNKQYISLNAENETVKFILKECLKGTEISYKMQRGSILLFRLPPPNFTISGYLTDAETGERLVGANLLEIKTLRGMATNGYGFFSLTLPRGENHIQCSYLGYKTKTIQINLRTNKTLDIPLKNMLILEEVVITAAANSAHTNTTPNHSTLPLEFLDILPAIGGESDLMQHLQNLPGISSGADGFGGLHVRGGNSDQNLILLDDVPVYNPSHSIGLFSIFNTDLIKNTKLLKGAFPARYSGRLSSVLDVRTREGNDQQFSAEASIGLIASKATIEMPIVKNKGAILITGRRTHIDNWFNNYSKKQKAKTGAHGAANYRFFDLNLKAHYSITNQDKIYLNLYNGGDSFSDTTSIVEVIDDNDASPFPVETYESEQEFAYSWGNTISSLRWNHLYNNQLFSNTTLTYSKFQYNTIFDVQQELSVFGNILFAFQDYSEYQSIIRDQSARIDFDYLPDGKQHIRFGASASKRSFVPGSFSQQSSAESIDSLDIFEGFDFDDKISNQATELTAYLEDEIRYNKLIINGGLHFTSFFAEEKTYLDLQPRLSFICQPNTKLSLGFSAGKMTQFTYLLTSKDAGLPNDIWVAANKDIGPQKSWQITNSIHWKPIKNWQFSIEGYWKNMTNLLVYEAESELTTPDWMEEEPFLNDMPSQILTANNWQNAVKQGRGKTYGFEWMAERQKGKLTGLASYTLAWSNRQFEGQATRPSRYDSRHNITMAFAYHFNDHIGLTANWLYRSGLPFLRSINSNNDNNNLPFFDFFGQQNITSNNNRLPANHRLDLGAYFHFGGEGLQHEFTLGVYNAYNRANLLFVVPNDNSYRQVNGLPILPSLSYKIRFQ